MLTWSWRLKNINSELSFFYEEDHVEWEELELHFQQNIHNQGNTVKLVSGTQTLISSYSFSAEFPHGQGDTDIKFYLFTLNNSFHCFFFNSYLKCKFLHAFLNFSFVDSKTHGFIHYMHLKNIKEGGFWLSWTNVLSPPLDLPLFLFPRMTLSCFLLNIILYKTQFWLPNFFKYMESPLNPTSLVWHQHFLQSDCLFSYSHILFHCTDSNTYSEPVQMNQFLTTVAIWCSL